MNDSGKRHGGCLCGAVRYTAAALPLAVAVCHCRDCQKQTGSSFSLIAAFARDQVALHGQCASVSTAGASGNNVTRYFCGDCGSPIYSETAAGRAAGMTFIKAGTLDEVDDLTPAAHFWTSCKQPWVDLPAGVHSVERE